MYKPFKPSNQQVHTSALGRSMLHELEDENPHAYTIILICACRMDVSNQVHLDRTELQETLKCTERDVDAAISTLIHLEALQEENEGVIDAYTVNPLMFMSTDLMNMMKEGLTI